ncbi:MAG TPA: hypothetical protein VND43_05890, partial [Burkholderiales bacterium]|nr:hypothetical protein [Burkholderiales bacterium]
QLHDRMNPMGVSYLDPEEPVKSSFSESLEPDGVLTGTGLVSPRNTGPGHHDIQPGLEPDNEKSLQPQIT